MSESTAPQLVKPKCCFCGTMATITGKALLHCGRCKNRPYCGKECQKQHWPFHKAVCKHTRNITAIPTPQGRKPAIGKGIFMSAIPFSASHHQIILQAVVHIDPTTEASFKWADVGISCILGFPLRMAKLGTGDTSFHNPYVNFLSIDVDPGSSTFGQSLITRDWHGDVYVMRVDGKDLHVMQIMSLLKYVEGQLEDIKAVKKMESIGRVVDREALAAQLLAPERFAAFVQGMPGAKLQMLDGFQDVDYSVKP